MSKAEIKAVEKAIKILKQYHFESFDDVISFLVFGKTMYKNKMNIYPSKDNYEKAITNSRLNLKGRNKDDSSNTKARIGRNQRKCSPKCSRSI